MPPPARLGLALSRACLASMNVFDLGVDVEGLSEGLVSVVVVELGLALLVAVFENVDVSDREDSGVIKSFWEDWLDIGTFSEGGSPFAFRGAFDEEPAVDSTILMGMRRRCGEIDADIGGAMSTGVFCATHQQLIGCVLDISETHNAFLRFCPQKQILYILHLLLH